MTALQSPPGSEKGGKGGKPPDLDAGTPFSGFSPFLEPETPHSAPAIGAAAALAAVRSYRRTPPPEPPRAPRRKPDAPPEQAARAHARAQGGGDLSRTLPGVPLDWCEGVARMASRPAPDAIQPRRWAILAAASARLLRDHGPALHTARWDAAAVFGLYSAAPVSYPPGWGLAWLLGEHGEVLDVAPDAVGMRREPRGWRMVCVRREAPAGIVPAWGLTMPMCSVG